MNKFSAEKYYKIGCLLGNVIQSMDWTNIPGRTFPDLTSTNILGWLRIIENDCRAIALLQSAKCTKRLLDELTGKGLSVEEMKSKLSGLQSLIHSEMEEELFLHVRSDFVEHYKKPEAFNTEQVKPSEAFPSITKDVEQAGNCLVSELGTACVFHLMRIMESGLKALATPLGIPYAPSWESYLKQINGELARNWKDKTPVWKNEEVFFKEAAGHLSAVRVAWRNPTMHIVRHYDVAEAEEILISVRAFMRHLATKLKE
jgi:hypothetical protein